MKNTIPEYQVKLNENGTILWQHRLAEELGNGVYKRDYFSMVEMGNDLADKFGRRFSNKVIQSLRQGS